jgi:hypothetical protein
VAADGLPWIWVCAAYEIQKKDASSKAERALRHTAISLRALPLFIESSRARTSSTHNPMPCKQGLGKKATQPVRVLLHNGLPDYGSLRRSEQIYPAPPLLRLLGSVLTVARWLL